MRGDGKTRQRERLSLCLTGFRHVTGIWFAVVEITGFWVAVFEGDRWLGKDNVGEKLLCEATGRSPGQTAGVHPFQGLESSSLTISHNGPFAIEKAENPFRIQFLIAEPFTGREMVVGPFKALKISPQVK
jgi:hypothetical protein